jgi:hypothetical protein
MCAVSLVWVGVFMLLASTGMLPDTYAAFASIPLCISGVCLGNHLSIQFRSAQSKLIPKFAAPHLTVAAGLCGMVAVLLVVVATFASHGTAVAAQWEGISRIGLLAFGWSLFLLCFSFGCFHPWAIALAFPSSVFFLSFIKAGSSIWLSVMSSGPVVALVLILNSILTFVLVRRMCRLNDVMIESHFHDLSEPSQSKRRAWSRERGRFFRGWNQTDKELDSIRRPIGGDLRSQVRHFQLGFGLLLKPITLVPILVVTFWVLHFAFLQIGRGSSIPDLVAIIGSTGSLSGALTRVRTNGRMSFQWIMMLPLRREEIVFRYGIALLIHMLKMWFTITIPLYIVAWLSLAGMPHPSPSLWPYMDSLAAQIPLFGVVTLFIWRPQVVGAYLAGAVVMLALMGAPHLNELGLPLLLPVMFLVLGVCTIAWSYRRWLQTDLS